MKKLDLVGDCYLEKLMEVIFVLKDLLVCLFALLLKSV